MLPEGWTSYRLGELMTFRNGLNYTRSDAGESIKVVGVGDFQARSSLQDSSDLDTITVNGQVREHDLLQDGDLLFVRSNGNKALIGRCLYFPTVTERLTFSGFTIRGRADTRKLDPEFASYLLRADHATAQMHLGGSGTNISNLSQEILNDVQVAIPSLIEQKHIKRRLQTWDLAILTTEKILANCRKQKHWFMQALLGGKRRMPGSIGPFVRAHASEIFEPVSIRRNDGLDLLSVMQDKGVFPRHLLDRKVVMPEGSTGAYKLVEPGNFVISLRSFEGGLEYSRYRGLVSPAYTVLKAKQPICDDFYRHYFKSHDFIGRLAVAVIGIRDGKQISYDDFAFLRLPLPSLKEQQAIAEVLNAAEAEIAQLEAQLESLLSEKRALLQDLLTGKRRVKQPFTDTVATPP